MKVILDTNIIFSALLNSHSFICDLLLNKTIEFVVPKFAYIELFKYKEKIMKFSRHNEDEILELLYRILKKTYIYDEDIISTDTLREAYKLVRDIDENDLIFVALTIELAGKLWSGDKQLVKALKEKGFNNLFDFQNFIVESEEIQRSIDGR
jgi:predicted nucleic acid-binding protein